MQIKKASRRSVASVGFTLVELIVVIAIVVLLIGILLPALSGAAGLAKTTKTQGTMNDFAKACDLFQQEHGFYPGILDEVELASLGNPPPISGTENALLHLMGGAIVWDTTGSAPTTPGFDIALPNNRSLRIFDPDGLGRATELGDGPVINGKRYGSYYSPAGAELGVARGQAGEPGNFQIPDLLDAWGNPIVYLRKARRIGQVFDTSNPANAQFLRSGADPYLLSTLLGEGANDQTSASGNAGYSLFNVSGTSSVNGAFNRSDWNLMQLIGHQGFTSGVAGANLNYTATRGEFMLVSAGPDGVYFSRTDGAGSASTTVDEIITAASISEWDDVVIVGGGK